MSMKGCIVVIIVLIVMVAVIAVMLEAVGVSSDASISVALILVGTAFLGMGWKALRNRSKSQKSDESQSKQIDEQKFISSQTFRKKDGDFDKVNLHTIEIPAVKIANPSHVASYKAEAIKPQNKPHQKANHPYKVFACMKNIAKNGYYDSADVFLRQAELMKDFEDNCEYEKPLDAYWTTYESMDDAQLRTYFTWRTKVRYGDIKNISLSMLFVIFTN